ncbi:ribonuclease H-like domain, reverse transcriptase, RNA-dependent DNA polymerase [Tanacetum coccineum]
MKCPQHYLTDMQKVILFYNGLDVPSRQIHDSKGVIPTKTDVDAKKENEKVYAAQVECKLCKGPHYIKDCPLKEEGKLLKRLTTYSLVHLINLEDSTEQHGQDSTNATTETLSIRNQGASIKTLEIQIGQMSKVLQERGFGSLPSSTGSNPMDHVKSISTTKARSNEIRRIGSGPYDISDSQYSNIFSETVPFPRRLHSYCCNDWKEAHEVKFWKPMITPCLRKKRTQGALLYLMRSP